MVGNVMADQSISLNDGVTVHGRALARIARGHLDQRHVHRPELRAVGHFPCRCSPPSRRRPSRSCRARPRRTTAPPRPSTTTTAPPSTPGVPPVSGPPRTGAVPIGGGSSGLTGWLVGLFGIAGIAMMTSLVLVRRRPAHRPVPWPIDRRPDGRPSTRHGPAASRVGSSRAGAASAAPGRCRESSPTRPRSPPSNRRPPPPPPPCRLPPSTTLPVPAALADSWLSMRAGPVPVPIELHVPTLGIHAAGAGRRPDRQRRDGRAQRTRRRPGLGDAPSGTAAAPCPARRAPR